HQPAGEDEPDRIRCLERKDDPTVTYFSPTDFGLQSWFEDSNHLAIDVVDGGGEEQQRADGPTVVADFGANSCERGWSCFNYFVHALFSFFIFSAYLCVLCASAVKQPLN